jgi:hypothetical protein
LKAGIAARTFMGLADFGKTLSEQTAVFNDAGRCSLTVD